MLRNSLSSQPWGKAAKSVSVLLEKEERSDCGIFSHAKLPLYR